MREFWYLFGLVAVMGSTFTQWRLPSIGIGFAEGFGAIAILAFMTQRRLTGPAIPILLCIGTMSLAILAGALTARLIDLPSTFLARDLLALIFACILALAVTSMATENARRFRLLLSSLDATVVLHLIPYIASLVGIEMTAWLGDVQGETVFAPNESRYVGFSVNPHQLGLFLCFYFPLAILTRGPSVLARSLWFAAVPAATLLCYLTVSYTLLFSVSAGLLTLGLVALFRKVGARNARQGLFVLSMSCIVVGLVSMPIAADVATSILGKGDDADASGRFPRWTNGVKVLIDSHGFGVGPGAHSGGHSPYEGEEAHNTILDLATQGGVVAAGVYLSLWAWAGIAALRACSPVAAAILASVLVQQFAHFTLRHPLGWLPLLLVLYWPILQHRKRIMEHRLQTAPFASCNGQLTERPPTTP